MSDEKCTCHWPGCLRPHGHGGCYCTHHWFRLPPSLRRSLNAGAAGALGRAEAWVLKWCTDINKSEVAK